MGVFEVGDDVIGEKVINSRGDIVGGVEDVDMFGFIWGFVLVSCFIIVCGIDKYIDFIMFVVVGDFR